MAKSATRKPKRPDLPEEVAAIRKEIRSFFNTKDEKGNRLGGNRCGVYAFYDYDGEPIYIGQTYEGLGGRIGRHLTNKRTDAVAMNVLDPFEVAEIRVWPIDLSRLNKKRKCDYLDRAEFTLFQRVIAESRLRAVLNEKHPAAKELVELPKPYTRRIIPDEFYSTRKHPDVRLARRANTIANLARVISERKVSFGLRRTLLTQARRLEKLAADRLRDFEHSSKDEKDSRCENES